MKKLFLTMLLVTILIVSCGKKTTNSNIIKIGVIAPLTGNYAQYGIAVKEGIELKVEAINNAGGINGKKIELVIADSKGDVQESVNAFKKMVSQDKVNIVIGEVVSATSQAISGLAQSAKVPLISATATSLDVTKGKDFVFRTTFTDPYQGTATAKYAKSKGVKSIAILTNSSNDYSVGIANAFKEQAAWYIKLTGIMATLYGIWLVYAAGLNYLLLSVILYLPGMVLFFYQRKHSKGYLHLSRVEKWLTLGLSLLFFAALYLLFQS